MNQSTLVNTSHPPAFDDEELNYSPKAVHSSNTRVWPAHVLSILGVVAVSISFAILINWLTATPDASPERGLGLVAALAIIFCGIPAGIVLYRTRLDSSLTVLGLVMIAPALTLLMASYFFSVGSQIMLPADILIWSESDFVNDILKFRQGYPIFTPEVNNESFTYVPCTQLTTYAIAWLLGSSTSIPVYRCVQVFFTLVAAFLALLACRRLISITTSDRHPALSSAIWSVVFFAVLFLIAGNSITNPFVFLLHNDALSQLVIMFSYWLLLEYEHSPNRRLLFLMVLMPAAGFWVKQSIIIWAVIFCVYVWLHPRAESRQMKLLFTVFTVAAVFGSVGIGWLLWREDFTYWVFDVLGAHGVSPFRSIKHLLDVWIYFAIGIAAAAIILPKHYKRLGFLWLTWLFLISTETYTSGIAWMLNHIGPGSLIAGVWMCSALAIVWNELSDGTLRSASFAQWSRSVAGLAVFCLVLNGLGAVHVPVRSFGEDAKRYVADIEQEFSGTRPDRILVDVGSWVYLPSGTVMKDRAPSIGERGYSETGDFSGILGRLKRKHYDKILVRNLHSDDFWYDHSMWRSSSGIKAALLQNYEEVRTIEPVVGVDPNRYPYGFNKISVLIPRTE